MMVVRIGRTAKYEKRKFLAAVSQYKMVLFNQSICGLCWFFNTVELNK